MESQQLISKCNVGQRLKKWMLERSFNAESFRESLTGIVIGSCLLDVILFFLLDDSIKHGQLPPYVLDVTIMCLGLLEAIACPLWAWLGRRVRITLMLCSLTVALASLVLFGVPGLPTADGTEFCTGPNSNSLVFQGITSAAAGRLVFIVIVAFVSVVSRAAIWTLSVAALDRGTPHEITLHFGLLLAVRVIGLRVAPRIYASVDAAWVRILGVSVPVILNSLQLLKFEEPPRHEPIAASIWSSFGRVVSSWQTVGQMFSTAFLAAALWGFGWHETEIKKTLYLTTDPIGLLNYQTEIMMSFVIVLAVVCYGMFYSRPPSFNRVSALKLATCASLVVIVLYCLLTMILGCSNGNVAGLGLRPANYSRPECSSQCGCAMPWSDFAPVCVVDTMTTYLSPCHAGCVSSDLVQTLTVLRGCACAPSAGLQRATLGACGVAACADALVLHRVLIVLIIILTVVCIQVQVVFILRAVKQRDRLAAFALASAFALSLTFSGGHLTYYGIQTWTCEWFEAGRCHLQSSVFAYAVGGLSAGLGLLAFLINIITWRVECCRSKGQIEADVALENNTENAFERNGVELN